MTFPTAKRIPIEQTLHGVTWTDEYAWLRDRNDPDTIAYLEAENAYTARETAHLDDLKQAIFDEIKARTQETDLSAPAKRGDWWYASRTEEGKQYPIMVRRRGDADGPEEVLLDLNTAAEGHDFLAVGVFTVSPDQRVLAYSLDTDGSEDFTLRFKDLTTGELLADVIEHTYYSAAWSADSSHLFYTTIDDAHRPYKVWRHELGVGTDELVYHEQDERMFLGVGNSHDDRYILIAAGSQTTSDVHYLPADDPSGAFAPVLERKHKVEYHAEHKDGRWLIVSNDDAVNGRLFSIAVDDPSDSMEVIPHDLSRKVIGTLPLRDNIIVFGRKDGLTSVTVLDQSGEGSELTFDEPVYTVTPGRNLEYETSTIRLSYQSLVTSPQVLDVDLATGERTVVKQTPVLGGYDPGDYETRRDWATSPDGTAIPISVVSKKGLALPAPAVLYGYGSYEISTDPWFSIARLSLLDRGVVFAIAHIRGGGEYGKPWYEAGKLRNKDNTFKDFIAAARHLIGSGVTAPDHLVAMGGSAGGLLMGAVAIQAPELFNGIVAEVPFVDVINTMLDATIPLTVIEWEEWGNPAEADDFGWMQAYSPYDNVDGAELPAMLVTGGLNDPRVAFWEPAKWVARMRHGSSNRGPLLLKMEMGAGHAGPSGRYSAWRETAFVQAFVLDRCGLS